jgi:hypothetical protein
MLEILNFIGTPSIPLIIKDGTATTLTLTPPEIALLKNTKLLS